MSVVTALPYGRPLEHNDLARTPDDGRRYELLDGMLLVSPAPRTLHQLAVARLLVQLSQAAPDGMLVLTAPYDVVLAADTVLQPDLLAAPTGSFTDVDLQGPPSLAVEVLSPSTGRVDLLLKPDRLAVAGCPSYWVVDPDVPAVTVLELQDGTYVEVGRATGDDVLEVWRPFPVHIRPGSLVG
jgi:Uma2 family endonuclease